MDSTETDVVQKQTSSDNLSNSLCFSLDKMDKDIKKVQNKKIQLQKRKSELQFLIDQWNKEEAEKKKQKETEEIKKQEIKNEDPEIEYKRRLIERFSYKNTELINRIYAENRAKAKTSHESLKHLNYHQEDLKMPLYNQPSDLVQYHENIEKYKVFKPRLIKFLQRKRQKEIQLEKHLNNDYDKSLREWVKKLEKQEANPKRKQKLQCSRQFYEKVFPEIKKQREQQERLERLGSRSVLHGGFNQSFSDDDDEEAMKELDPTQQQMHRLAVQPPHLLSRYERRVKYINSNGLIRNLEVYEKERKANIIWSEDEKQIFRDKFSAFPKDFEKISSFLDKKTCSDCVLFYYQNKKKEYFKSSKLRKKKGKKPIPLKKPATTTKPGSKENVEQVEVEEEEEEYEEQSEEEQEPKMMEIRTDSQRLMLGDKIINPIGTITTTSTITMSISTAANPSVEGTTARVGKTNPVVKVFNTRSKANAAANAAKDAAKDTIKDTSISTTAASISANPTSTQLTTTTAVSESNLKETLTLPISTMETPKAPLKMKIIVTSPSNMGDSSSTMSVASIVSETVTAAAAGMAVDEGSNPPPSASTAQEISTQGDALLAQTFQVEELIRQHLNKMPDGSQEKGTLQDVDVKNQAFSATDEYYMRCFIVLFQKGHDKVQLPYYQERKKIDKKEKRRSPFLFFLSHKHKCGVPQEKGAINRRKRQNSEHSDPSRWSESEMMKAVDGLKRFGRNWNSISKLVETKSEAQCKNFYFNYKKKFQLESILGISKGKGKDTSESSEQQEEDLIPYLEELERQEQIEKQKQQDTSDKQKTDTKTNSKAESRTKGGRGRSNKLKSNDARANSGSGGLEITTISTEESTTSVPYDHPELHQQKEQPKNITRQEEEEVEDDEEEEKEDEEEEEEKAKHVIQPVQVQLHDAVKRGSDSKTIPQVIKTSVQQQAQRPAQQQQQQSAQQTPQSTSTPSIVESTPSEEPVLRPPPPLVTYKPAVKQEKTKAEITEFGPYQTNLSLLEKERQMKEHDPHFDKRLTAAQIKDRLFRHQLPPEYPASSASRIPILNPPGGSKQYFENKERLMNPEHLKLAAQALQPSSKLAVQNPTSIDKNVAIEAFHSYPGYMSLPSVPVSSQQELITRLPVDLQSPRFPFQQSSAALRPSTLPQRGTVEGRNVPSHIQARNVPPHIQARMRAPHNPQIAAQIAASAGMSAPISPVMSKSGSANYNSPPEPDIIYASQLEEMKRQRELEQRFRQKQQQQQLDPNEMLLRHEMEAEREAQLKYRQKEIEMQRIEAQHRKQDHIKFLQMQQMQQERNRRQYDWRREAVAQRVGMEQQEKERRLFADKLHEHGAMAAEDILHRKRLFAEKILEHGPMSEEMVLALSRHHFGAYASGAPNSAALAEARATEFGSHGDIRKMMHEKSREQYLTKLPHHPQTHRELSQRAASIPDLRTAPEPFLKEMARHSRLRTNSGTEHKSVIPEDKSQEFYPRKPPQVTSKHFSSHLPPESLYDNYGELNKGITLPEVPLEPLSRPGSANSEKSEQLPDRAYGISTGLARKPPPLTLISGPSSKTPPNIKIDKQFTDPKRSQSPHDPLNIRRKSTIVRPWEISSDVQKVNTPPPPLTSDTKVMSPAPSMMKSTSPRLPIRTQSPGRPLGKTPPPPLNLQQLGATKQQPVIQLAATSNQFKEQIISLAKGNSPAPQMFPKFNFAGAPPIVGDKNETRLKDSQTSRKRSTRSNSEQSLSPTFPMPATNLQTTPQKPDLESRSSNIVSTIQDIAPIDEVQSRPRSDSEETISADEGDASKETSNKRGRKEMATASTVTTANTDQKSSKQLKEKLQNPTLTVTPTFFEPVVTAQSSVSSSPPPPPKASLLMQRLRTDSSTSSNSPRSVGSTSPYQNETLTTLPKLNSAPELSYMELLSDNTSIPAVISDVACDASSQATSRITAEIAENISDSSQTKDEVKSNAHKTEENETVVPVKAISKTKAKSKPKSNTSNNTPQPSNSTQVSQSIQILPPTNQTEHNDKLQPSSCDALKANVPPVASTSVSVRPDGAKERPESPDIYDDLKVHEYDDGSSQDSPNDDLYSEVKAEENDELLKLTNFKEAASPIIKETTGEILTEEGTKETKKNDVEELVENVKTISSFSSKELKDEAVSQHSESSDKEDIEIQQINQSQLQQQQEPVNEPTNRDDASTPVLDEPQFPTGQTATTASKTIDSPGTPEAKTPLLDEPEYDFKTIIGAPGQMEYLKYTNPPPGYMVVSDETKASDKHARLGYLQAFERKKKQTSQEAFESITPPSSPERDAKTSDVTPTATTPAIAFPFSALAFNVGSSRPSSRSSGSGYSPSHSDDRSPRYETESQSSSSSRNRRKRSRDRDNNEDLDSQTRQQYPTDSHSKRLQKHSYRRSASQSSAGSSTKSPEADYRSRIHQQSSASGRSPKPSSSSSQRRGNNKRSSNSPGHHSSHKKPRN